MKHEELKRHTFSSLEEIKLACFKYIDGFYNPKKPHSAIDKISPNLKKIIGNPTKDILFFCLLY